MLYSLLLIQKRFKTRDADDKTRDADDITIINNIRKFGEMKISFYVALLESEQCMNARACELVYANWPVTCLYCDSRS